MTERSEKRRGRTWIIVVVIIVILLVLCGCVAVVAGIAVWSGQRPGVWPWRGTLEGIEVPRIGGQTEATRELADVFDVETPVLVEVENNVGSIEIVGTDEQEVVVEVVIRGYGSTRAQAEQAADDVEITMEQRDEDHIYVVGRTPSRTLRQTPNVAFVLHVPRECDLEITNNVGDVHVQEIDGAANIEVDVGTIDVRGWTMTQDSYLSTDVGKIQARLWEESAFYLDASANVGDIDTDFDVEGARDRQLVPGDRLEGAVGEDPYIELRVRTDVGDIKILQER